MLIRPSPGLVARALHDTTFNAWYDHETDDIAGLVDVLIGG